MAQTTHPDCFKCRHLKVTWNPQQPYACQAMGFRSRQAPWQVVVRVSGKPCMLFEAKPTAKPKA